MQTLFISDLHLGSASGPNAVAFFSWLSRQAPITESLYILGDFFDAWIGDDEDHPVAIQVKLALKDFAKTCKVYFLHGNRDFLIGATFAEQVGLELLPEATVINLYGTPTLLMHGDSLCTRDAEYMQFRAMVRNPAWQQQVLSVPLAQRRQMAADLRSKSQSMNAIKADDIMDVTPQEVVAIMERHQVQRLIHGHTHRPAIHSLSANGTDAERWVLGDWHETGWCIKATAEKLDLLEFPLDQ